MRRKTRKSSGSRQLWLYRRTSPLVGDLPWAGVRVEQADGSILDFQVGEHVRALRMMLPGNLPFVIDDIIERDEQPIVIVRFENQLTQVDPFELVKLSPLEQLAAEAEEKLR